MTSTPGVLPFAYTRLGRMPTIQPFSCGCCALTLRFAMLFWPGSITKGPILKCSRSAPASGALLIGVRDAMFSVLGDAPRPVGLVFEGAALGDEDPPHAAATSRIARIRPR